MTQEQAVVAFSKIIEECEGEAKPFALPQVMAWADANFDNAWSRLLDQFEVVIASGDQFRIEIMAQMYRTQVLGYVAAYKQSNSRARAKNVLQRIREKKQEGT